MKHLKYLFLLIFLTSGISSQDQNWFYRNPLPQNDLYSIKFLNPDTGYVCGSKGLILKTITGDNQWLNQSLATSRNLYSMYFFDAERGFTVGDSGLIIRTTNGGSSWLEITAGLSIALRSITFSDSVTGFAAGDNGTIIKSTNGGESWSVNYNSAYSLRSVYFVSSSTGFACGTNGLLLRTTNSGLNWSTQYLGSDTLNCICFSDSLNGFIAGFDRNIYKSSDGGLTWSGQFFGWGSWHTVKFLNRDFGYLGGTIIMVTLNGGEVWQEYPIGTYGSFFNDICPVDTFLYTCSTKGSIYKIFNNIFFGKKINIGGSMHPFSSISFINENTGCIVNDDEYLRTTNGGLNWDIDLPLYRGFEGGESFIDVIFFSPSSAYRIIDATAPTAFHEYYLKHSTDGGLTWNGPRSFNQLATLVNGISEVQGTTYITIGFGGMWGPSPGIKKNNGSGWFGILNSDSLHFDKISFANQNTGVCTFRWPSYGFVRTTDGGANWFTFNSFFPEGPINVQLLPSGVGYVIGDSSLFERTTDFGVSWTYIPHSISKMFVKLQFIDNNTGWLISQNYGWPYINRLYYTSNGGLDLLQVESLDSFNVRGITFLDALTGYVCGDSGTVLKTTNGGLVFVDPLSSYIPKSYFLSQNYPNPFNPATTINYELPKAGYVKLVVYDILGREIAVLVNEKESAGKYKVQWDASAYPSGVYFCKLITDKYSATIKLILLK